MTDITRHFASSRELADYMRARVARGYRMRYASSGWDSDSSNTRDGMAILTNGDDTNLQAAVALLEHFSEAVLAAPAAAWAHSIAGAFPDVPAAIAGDPESMWVSAPTLSERTPLRIWVGLTSSGAIPARDLAKRGCALAALALALVNKRPVLISPYVNLGNGTRVGSETALVSWDISTSPLVLSELLGCVSSPSVTRYAGIEACHMLNSYVTGSWHRDYSNEERMREHLHAEPADLYLSSIHKHDELLTNSITWLHRQLEKYDGSNSS